MIAFDRSTIESTEHAFCPFAGRRDGKDFVYSDEEIQEKYKDNMKMTGRMPEALSGAMGNQMYIARFETEEGMNQFYQDVLSCKAAEAKTAATKTVEKKRPARKRAAKKAAANSTTKKSK